MRNLRAFLALLAIAIPVGASSAYEADGVAGPGVPGVSTAQQYDLRGLVAGAAIRATLTWEAPASLYLYRVNPSTVELECADFSEGVGSPQVLEVAAYEGRNVLIVMTEAGVSTPYHLSISVDGEAPTDVRKYGGTALQIVPDNGPCFVTGRV